MLKLRYITLIAIVFSLFGSLMMLALGVTKSVKAFQIFFLGIPMEGPEPPEHLTVADQAMIALVRSIDAFLIAIVFFIFSAGIYGLFINDIKGIERWRVLDIGSVEHLKKTVVEMILVVLAVWFLSLVLYEGDALKWEILVLPLSIALISLSIRWMGWKGESKAHSEPRRQGG